MKSLLRTGLLALLGVALVLATLAPAPAAGPDPKDMQASVDKAVTFLKGRQGEDGSFSPKLGGPGITALVLAAMLRQGVSPDDPVVAKGLKYLEASIKKDGGIYDKKLANYTTSVALLALTEANTKGKYDTVIKNAGAFLKTLQDDSLKEDDVAFGGVGYDGKTEFRDFLKPGASFRDFEKGLRGLGADERVLFVGHQPSLGDFVAHMVSQSADLYLNLGKASLTLVETGDETDVPRGELKWMLTAKHLAALA